MKLRQWFRFDAAADEPTVAEIYLIDFIGDWIDEYWGFGVTAKAFVEQLAKLPEGVTTIRLHINSPGGDVFAAVNIANALRDQRTSKGRTVEVIVDGLAASAASVVMMAGDTIAVSDNALVMIHNPWTVAVGDADEMRKSAGLLDKVRGEIVTTYQWHSALSADELSALMDADTWMDADEALANGFATEKVEGLKAAASIDPRAVAALKVPERFRARVAALLVPAAAEPSPESGQPAPEPPSPPPAAEVLRRCRDAGCLDLAEQFLETQASLPDVDTALAAAVDARTREAARASEIRTLCQVAKLPGLADGYIAGAMPVAAVRAHLTTITATLQQATIDGTLMPDAGARPTPRIDTAAVYARLNHTTKE